MYLTRLKKTRRIQMKDLKAVAREGDRHSLLKCWILDDSLPDASGNWNPLQNYLRRPNGRVWLDQASGQLIDFFMLDAHLSDFEYGAKWVEASAETPTPPSSADLETPGFFDVLGARKQYVRATHHLVSLFGTPYTGLPLLIGYFSIDDSDFYRLSLTLCGDEEQVRRRFLEMIGQVEQVANQVMGAGPTQSLLDRTHSTPIPLDAAKEVASRLRLQVRKKSPWRWGNLGQSVEAVISALLGMQRPEPPPPPAVDLRWTVTTVMRSGRPYLQHRLENPSREILATELTGTVGPIDSEQDNLIQARAWISEIKTRQVLPTSEEYAALRTLGQELWMRLVPADLRQFLAQHHGQIQSLWFLDGEYSLPWEITVPDWPCLDDSPPFLGCRVAVGRWLDAEIKPASSFQIQSALNVLALDDSEGLSSSTEPTENLLRGFFKSRQVHGPQFLKDPRLHSTLQALSQSPWDWIYLCGHGSGAGDQAQIQLAGRRLRPLHFDAKLRRHLSDSRPLVILDACSTGVQAPALTGVGGWPDRLTRQCQCGALISTLWPVEGATSQRFLAALLDNLRPDVSLGEALRRSRHRLLLEGPNVDALAYTLYGHPNAQLTFL